MDILFTAIVPIVLLIIVGIVLERFLPHEPHSSTLMCKLGLGSCTTWTTVLNQFALYLALPALIFSSLVRADKQSLLDIHITLYILLLLIGVIGCTWFITHILQFDHKLKNTYIFGTFFGNIAYIGPPFLVALYGEAILGSLSLIIAIHIAIAFSIGLGILEYSKHRHAHIDTILIKLITNPLLIAVVLGVIFLMSDITLPVSVLQAISMLAASASPVVLIAVGTFIATEWKPSKHIKHAITITILKIIVMPLLFLLVGVLFLEQNIVRDIAILEAAMPVALTTFALSEKYPIDKTIIANAIILSTIAAAVTLSVFSAILV